MDQAQLSSGFSLAVDSVQGWISGFYTLLPNIIAGILFLILFTGIALFIKKAARAYFQRKDRPDLGTIVAGLAFWIFVAIGGGIALTIIIPSIQPSNLVASFGLGSIAAGFVFKDIFQNWFAGLLILLRLPFRRGDQIKVGEVEGTVMRIDPRATILRSYDGRDIVVPNYTVFNDNVIIHTSQPQRRIEISLTVGYNYPIRTITEIIGKALAQVDEIFKEPAPQILCWNLGSTSLEIKVRWWVKSGRTDEVISRARAVQAIKEAFDANDIDPTDPQLVYSRIIKDESEIEADVAKPARIVSAPAPPKVPILPGDPENDHRKIDDKAETILPKN